MQPTEPTTDTPSIVAKIVKTLCTGDLPFDQAQWLVQTSANLATDIVSFFAVFTPRTREQIFNTLKETNYCKTIGPALDAWTPKDEWDIIIKLVIELVLNLIHKYSPDNPSPVPPPPGPDESLVEYVRNYLEKHIHEPNKHRTATALAREMRRTIVDFKKKAPTTTEEARSRMRIACHEAAGYAHPDFDDLSNALHTRIEKIADEKPPLDLNHHIALWESICSGLEETK